MDDLTHGTDDGRGHWKPNALIRPPNVFVWTPQLPAILKWVSGYVIPFGLFYCAPAFLVSTALTPSSARAQPSPLDWIALVALRNATLLVLIVCAQYCWRCVRRAPKAAQ